MVKENLKDKYASRAHTSKKGCKRRKNTKKNAREGVYVVGEEKSGKFF